MNAIDQAQDLNMLEIEAIQRRARLPDVAQVLERDCGNCGSEIPPARLAVVPYTHLCVHCQSVIEARHRGFRRG